MSTKGQVVIPKNIREQVGLKEGDALVFKVAGNAIQIEKMPNQSESMVELLRRGQPFPKDLVRTLRKEWE